MSVWRQGAERIPPSELPVQFNEKAAGIEGALGVDCLYEVVCADCSDLDTLYCSMCGVWTFPNEMFKHLETVEHKLAYLFRNYKMYHQTVVSETNSIVREAMLSQFAIQIWKMEKPPGQVSNRLRSLLDRATIERIWPEYVNVLDHSWKESARPPLNRESGRRRLRSPRLPADHMRAENQHLLTESAVDLEAPIKTVALGVPVSVVEAGALINVVVPEVPKSTVVAMISTRMIAALVVQSVTGVVVLLEIMVVGVAGVAHVHAVHDTGVGAAEVDPVGVAATTACPAFLAKLGDAKAAAKVLDSSKEKKSSKRASSKSFVDEKIKQLRSLANPIPSSNDKVDRESERSKPSSSSDSDEKVQMRKLLGVLITMQQEAERNGNLDESIIDKLYREVGLKKSVEASSDQLLAQICSQITQDGPSSSKPAIDLQSFGISTQPQPVPSQPAPSIFGGGFNTQPVPSAGQPSTIQSLLSEVKRSLGSLRPPRPPSPLVRSPPFVITKRDDVFPDAETISYVFPGADSKDIQQASNSNTPPAEDKLSKKEKAALRRKMLLEEAERLRRQAEEECDDDDDEWDCLAEVINNPPPPNKVNTVEQPSGKSHNKSQDQRSSAPEKSQDRDRRPDDKERSHSRKSDDKGRSHDRRSDDREREKSHDRRTSEKEDSKRSSDSKKSNSTREEEGREKKLDPIAPGQKMPLQRTILPDGKPSREAKKEEMRAKAKEKKEEREKNPMRGVPSHWPQPVPQPLLGLSLERPPQHEEPRQPMRQEPFQPPPQQFPMQNEPAYPPMGNNPVYPNQYPPMYPNQPPHFQNPQYYPGQQFMGQPPMNGFGGPPGPPMQQQFYGHPPYY
ncbi:hypothetical protein ANCCAN_18066 [Ancylostoma caninum]|uniref:Uncharacterized protein n=1 Tax=Ancylostoma caninum TaxID=29170 RepID=A0A368G0F0_ANCCA|nr:hypothetical protein ANCCAN_18066 [Ancylostoma caninum]